ncbi:hypothetical protein AMECASPLE_036400 [Ameca splendens]|uniref:Uncharacterized protein n=1 Tax=Ameca splendens TaxID=208324 RepID=A0ABV0ZGE5_9TELE
MIISILGCMNLTTGTHNRAWITGNHKRALKPGTHRGAQEHMDIFVGDLKDRNMRLVPLETLVIVVDIQGSEVQDGSGSLRREAGSGVQRQLGVSCDAVRQQGAGSGAFRQ